MDLIIYEKDAYNKMLDEKAVRDAHKEDEWLNAGEAKKMLGIKSDSKLQHLRDNNEIIYSQHERTIMYSRNGILEFLERHSNKK
ncbi:MAG: helix-turn-helix domain-containing protein [Bacteroidetes bacterium]|nr:helix-turn-helix domain-containing protein [Bacteroidota bacterium]